MQLKLFYAPNLAKCFVYKAKETGTLAKVNKNKEGSRDHVQKMAENSNLARQRGKKLVKDKGGRLSDSVYIGRYFVFQNKFCHTEGTGDKNFEEKPK